MPSKAKATAITGHNEIRQWAEERGAKPACVRNTGSRNDVGILRLEFPGSSSEQSLETIEWDEWFEKFDEQGLALIHQETLANGKKSNFNKLVSRETANANQNRSTSNRSTSGRSSKITTMARAESGTKPKSESIQPKASRSSTTKSHTAAKTHKPPAHKAA